jgi:hypothetical protein
MIVVATAGVVAAAFRVHVLLGLYAGGTSLLMLARAFLAIERLRASGQTITTGLGAALLVDSLGVANVLAAAATFGFLVGASLALMAVLLVRPDADSLIVVGSAGIVAAFGVSFRLRHRYWPLPAPFRPSDVNDATTLDQ